MKPKPLSSENHLTVPVVRIAGLLWLSNRRSATLRSSASCATSGLLVFAGTRPAAVALRRSEGRSEGPATSASNSDSPIRCESYPIPHGLAKSVRRSFRTRLHLADRPPAGAAPAPRPRGRPQWRRDVRVRAVIAVRQHHARECRRDPLLHGAESLLRRRRPERADLARRAGATRAAATVDVVVGRERHVEVDDVRDALH